MSSFKLESYVSLNLEKNILLSILPNFAFQIINTKWRCRYKKSSFSKICKMCHDDCVEDEFHSVMTCPVCSTLRENFFCDYIFIYSKFCILCNTVVPCFVSFLSYSVMVLCFGLLTE